MILGTFEDKEITHVEGEVDPIRDLDIINEELRLKDEEQFLKVFDDLEKKYQRGEKKLKQEYVSHYLWTHLHFLFHSVWKVFSENHLISLIFENNWSSLCS